MRTVDWSCCIMEHAAAIATGVSVFRIRQEVKNAWAELNKVTADPKWRVNGAPADNAHPLAKMDLLTWMKVTHANVAGGELSLIVGDGVQHAIDHGTRQVPVLEVGKFYGKAWPALCQSLGAPQQGMRKQALLPSILLAGTNCLRYRTEVKDVGSMNAAVIEEALTSGKSLGQSAIEVQARMINRNEDPSQALQGLRSVSGTWSRSDCISYNKILTASKTIAKAGAKSLRSKKTPPPG